MRGGDRRRDRRAARRRVRQRIKERAEHGTGIERIAAGRNEHIDLIRRQPEARLHGVESGRALRPQLLERDASNEELHVLAVPSRRRAEADAVEGAKAGSASRSAFPATSPIVSWNAE